MRRASLLHQLRLTFLPSRTTFSRSLVKVCKALRRSRSVLRYSTCWFPTHFRVILCINSRRSYNTRWTYFRIRDGLVCRRWPSPCTCSSLKSVSGVEILLIKRCLRQQNNKANMIHNNKHRAPGDNITDDRLAVRCCRTLAETVKP